MTDKAAWRVVRERERDCTIVCILRYLDALLFEKSVSAFFSIES